MDFISRLRQEHEILQVMTAIFKELIKRLSKAKAVNLRDVEDIYSLCAEYLVSHHLCLEEDCLFVELRKERRPLCVELAQAHAEIRSNLKQMREVINRLRSGRPNSGRELVRIGENLVWLIESHLRAEGGILDDQGVNQEDALWASYDLFRSGPQRKKLIALGLSLSGKLKRLSLEYLGKELNLAWLEQVEDNGFTEEEPLRKDENVPECSELKVNEETERREEETAGEEVEEVSEQNKEEALIGAREKSEPEGEKKENL